jgi:hypothetical protein
MNDTHLYHQLADLNPQGDVSEVKIDPAREDIEIHIIIPRPGPAGINCHCVAVTALGPDCGKINVIYDHREIRRQRHLDMRHTKT